MRNQDETATINERHWEWAVKKGAGCTIPWLDLDPALLRQYARGELEPVPERLTDIVCDLSDMLADVEDRDVLCLAAGGGQQSAVFGLLGACVTVVDLCEGQLQGDRRAAAHYGYEVTTIHADMRDLSCLDDASFDLVYGTGMCFVPDVHQVYSEVARVLRFGGVYRVDFTNPATEFVDWDSWDGEGYRITMPYAERKRVERIEEDAEPSLQFRHYLDDIFNGLLDAGFSIERVFDPLRYKRPDPKARTGSWSHWETYVGRFSIVAKKE